MDSTQERINQIDQPFYERMAENDLVNRISKLIITHEAEQQTTVAFLRERLALVESNNEDLAKMIRQIGELHKHFARVEHENNKLKTKVEKLEKQAKWLFKQIKENK